MPGFHTLLVTDTFRIIVEIQETRMLIVPLVSVSDRVAIT